jgi:GT2 family glycosyltransferase
MVPVSCAVLIVGYHAYDALERCLASLNPYLEPADEVVVVDHDSDETLLRQAVRACPRAVAIARRENPGFAAGVNLAASHSSAPFLLLLNPDTELLAPVPRSLEAWLLGHPDGGVVGPRVLDADGTVQSSARRFPNVTTLLGGRSTRLSHRFPRNRFTQMNVLGRDATRPVEVDWLAGSCFMTPRKVFDRLNGLDESFFLYWEDADYCRRATRAGYRCTYLPLADVRHVAGASSSFAQDRSIREFHRSAYRLYLKHGGALARVMAPFVKTGLSARSWLHRRRVGRRQGRRAA